MTGQDNIRVLIADDHTIVREGLATLLDAFVDLTLVGEARNGVEAVRLCDEVHPHIVLMDMIMPEMGGVEAIRLIRQNNPDIQIIALTSFKEQDMVQAALKAGALGYLLKDVSAGELVEAIRKARVGRPTLASEATQALIRASTASPGLGHDLTPREREILALMVAGMTNAQIAYELSITSSTAKNHVSNILDKLNAGNRAEAVALALKHKLVHNT